jgi:molybdopterin synthase catalytic subunit
VDELKKKVPIWKRPKFKDASHKRPGSSSSATTGAAALAK